MKPISFQKILIGELSWKRLMRSILFIYTFFALYVYFRADSLIFLAQPATYTDHESILKLPVNQHERISALHFPNPAATFTLLYIHGNAEDLGAVQPQLQQFQQWGYSVFAYDYRGYGTSDGKAGEKNAYEDAAAAYRYLTQTLKIPSDRIIVYGRSVGGGSAVELATRYPIAGLILESTFTSAFRVIAPIPLLPFDKFENLKKIKTLQVPLLVMHGEADGIIPIAHGRALFDAAPGPKLAHWEPNAGHNDFFWVAGQRQKSALDKFQALLLSSATPE